jgi:predicted DNA-binding transcriptional regulator AlpA
MPHSISSTQSSTSSAPVSDRLLREKDIRLGNPNTTPAIPPTLPISHAYFWQLLRDGILPKPIKLGKRCTVWRESDIQAFIASREAQK